MTEARDTLQTNLSAAQSEVQNLNAEKERMSAALQGKEHPLDSEVAAELLSGNTCALQPSSKQVLTCGFNRVEECTTGLPGSTCLRKAGSFYCYAVRVRDSAPHADRANVQALVKHSVCFLNGKDCEDDRSSQKLRAEVTDVSEACKTESFTKTGADRPDAGG